MAQHHKFSEKSLKHLNTCVLPLRHLCHEALEIVPFDMTVLCGVRSKEDQEKAVREGHSKVHWPAGRHNLKPGQHYSRAVDIVPYPIDWENTERFYVMIGVFIVLAKQHNIRLRFGADWNNNGDYRDQKFIDLPHIEVIEMDLER